MIHCAHARPENLNFQHVGDHVHGAYPAPRPLYSGNDLVRVPVQTGHGLLRKPPVSVTVSNLYW